MSLESTIQELNASVTRLIDVLNNLPSSVTTQNKPASHPVKQTSSPIAAAPVAPVFPTPAPVVTPAPVSAPPVSNAALPQTVAVMPPPPVWAAPASTPTPKGEAALPFNDSATLITYAMAVYKELGPAKGAAMQEVLLGLGYKNVNDVKPEHYRDLFNKLEALKKVAA